MTVKKPKLSAKAVKLLRKVEKHILAEPKRFYMGWWGTHYSKDTVEESDALPPCGTVACIAGWASILALPKGTLPTPRFIDSLCAEKGQEVLELTISQSCRLFHVDSWPSAFNPAGYSQLEKQKQAELAVARIEHFIATGGAE